MSGPDAAAPPSPDPEALAATLDRRFRTTVTELALGEPPRRLTLLHPADPEALINQEDFDRDERLPYWADLWPSARVLAADLIGADGAGRRLLELGCGAGLVAAAAALAGFDVTATDYYGDALLFTRMNVWRNARRPVATRLVDWRALPADLGRFERVVASDVLYERPYAALVAAAIDATLALGGTAIVADPGRVAAEEFLRETGRLGLALAASDRVPVRDGARQHTITLHRLRRTTGR